MALWFSHGPSYGRHALNPGPRSGSLGLAATITGRSSELRDALP